jgi:transposase-like protein
MESWIVKSMRVWELSMNRLGGDVDGPFMCSHQGSSDIPSWQNVGMSRVARTTVASLSQQIVTEADAYLYLEQMRWGDAPICGHCGSDNVAFMVPKNGVSRRTATGTLSQHRRWQCRPCRKQFSVLTGTIMHATKIPVRTWILVMFEMCATKNGTSAREIERKYGVTCKAAWHMLHRIRQAMATTSEIGSMRGTIVSDETWVGGDPKWRHAWQRIGGTQGKTDKTPVLTLVNMVTGEVRSQVVPNVTSTTLRKVISEQVDMANNELITDAGRFYLGLGQEFASHQSVNHKYGEYVRGYVSTNMAEGFFAQLKRSLDGTHHHVTRMHLPRYLGEFDFRYSTCKMSDHGRMRTLAKQMEGRLSYDRLVAC